MKQEMRDLERKVDVVVGENGLDGDNDGDSDGDVEGDGDGDGSDNGNDNGHADGIADADADIQSRNLTSTPMAKLMLRLEKGIRMVISGFVAAQGWPAWILGFFTRATTLGIVRLYFVKNMNCRILIENRCYRNRLFDAAISQRKWD